MADTRTWKEAYGEALVELGRENESVVVLDADVSGRTGTDYFAREFPGRFFNMGIAEQNMVDVAAGLASCGKIAYASSFAMFAAGKGWEQFRQSIAYPRLNVKLVASHAGVTVGRDGPSHQSTEDIAIMRAIPNTAVISPCDAIEAKLAIKRAAEYDGPVYIRMGRNPVPTINRPNYEFRVGEAVTLKDGSDLCIVATGVMVAHALNAADVLRLRGVEARVINVHTIKPIDRHLLAKAAKETGSIVTVEDHTIVGGLGGAVAELLAETCPVRLIRVGLRDTFAESGSPEELLTHYHMAVPNIVDAAQEVIKKRGRGIAV